MMSTEWSDNTVYACSEIFFKFRKRIHLASVVVLDDVSYEENEDQTDISDT